jgi:biotin synthase
MAMEKILQKTQLTRDDLIALLSVTEPAELQKLYAAGYAQKLKVSGNFDYYRGLIEFSNRCIKNCLYCGIRRDNTEVQRFDTTLQEILAQARWIYEQNFGSIVLQSGERQDPEFITFVETVLREIKKLSHGELGITLCVGEETEATYRRWFEAGAHRYLLRIESSKPELYKTLHPQDGHHVWQVRKHCLELLRQIGYQVGTGVMIGLPGQTVADLADDILFYRDMDIDMIGMGPYVVHHNTPLGKQVVAAGLDSKAEQQRRLELSLKMIAVTRLFLKDVNIAATTALQALHPLGREMGLKAGANVLMPVATLPEFRTSYLLYDNKPCVADSATKCRDCLDARIAAIGDRVGYGAWGDSKHFYKKQEQ